jgi:hypothetical protein
MIRTKEAANILAMSELSLTAKEAAAFLRCSESTLRNWRCEGRGPAFHKLSERKVIYDRADLERFKLERRCVPSPGRQ